MDHRLEQRRSLPLRQQSKTWARWHLPGDGPQPYVVCVDETDAVWVSDWGANAILRFDPKTEKFDSFPLPDRMPACGSSRAARTKSVGRIGCRQALCAADGVKYASGEYR